MNITKLVRAVSLFFIFIATFRSLPAINASNTLLSVYPTKLTPQVNEFFNVTIAIEDVINLSCWQLELIFDPEIITCTNYFVPEDNIFGDLIISPPAKINNTSGRIFAFCAIDANYGVNGSGILCKIEFQAKFTGISYLDIKNEMSELGTYLMDPSNTIIPFVAADGIVEVQDGSFQENIYNVTQNNKKYFVIIYSNATVSSFSYYSSDQRIQYLAEGPESTKSLVSMMIPISILDTPYAILLNGSSIYYRILENATYSFIHFEIHSTVEVVILSTIPYDINGDRIVNMLDLYLIARIFGATPNDPIWNPLMDINSDEIVNMMDLWIVAIHFGEIWG